MRFKRKFARLNALAGALLLVSLGAAACGGSEGASGTQTLRFAVNNPQDSDRGAWEQDLADRIAEETGGDYEVQIYWEGALGAERTALEAVESDAVQLGIASSSNTSGLIPEFAALDLPFLVPQGWDDLEELMASEPMQDLEKAAEAKGYKLICWVPEGFRQLMLTDDQVKTPADLDGMKLRTTASPIEADYVDAFGAQPTAIDFSEAYLALKQGTADGLFVAFSSIVQYQMMDAVKHSTVLNVAPILAPVMMNLDYFNSLPEDAQAAIEKAGEDTYEANLETTIQADTDFRKEMEEAGIEVYDPSADELDAWHHAAEAVYEKYPEFEAWQAAVS